MPDHFALLNEPRRPWIDPEELKSRFFALSSEVHPDRVHNAGAAERENAGRRYAELNAAYQCLKDDKSRLAHLLELELGSKPQVVQSIPPGMMDLCMEMGQLCRKADSVIEEKAMATSPMVKVQLFQKGMEYTETLNAFQQRMNLARENLLAELKAMNALWETAPPIGSKERRETLPLQRLEEIHRTISYLTRWTGQVQERIVQLAF